MITTTMGSYPRPKEFKEYLQKNLGRQKRDGHTELDVSIFKSAVEAVVKNQVVAGVDIPTDGQLLWDDCLAYMATKISGFEMNGLLRYLDNNLYYRQPVVTEKLERREGIVLDEFKIAQEIAGKYGKNIKAGVSCYTLSELSLNKFYKNKGDLILDLAGIMHEEIKGLVELGAKYIQIDEPALISANKKDLEIAKDAIDIMTRDIAAKFFLITYFGSAEKIFPEVLDFNVHVIGMDFVTNFEKNLSLVKEYGIDDMGLNFGCIDARNTKMENKEEIRRNVDRIVEYAREIYISPNSGLEFLPYGKAFEKLKIMCQAVKGMTV
jgi:5-methyltetrahydropteroyltriglutamate--homocysteine methyltransferase